MNAPIKATLLGRRLDRLRTHQPAALPRPTAAGHAQTMAATLGGQVQGSIVVFESRHRVALRRSLLDRLPITVSASRPLVCLDLETTGLATGPGTLAFLVGLGSWDGEMLIVRQLLLPDHTEEPALLDAIEELLPADAALVTYNGRSFDWPLLVARYRMHGRPPPPIADHHDLLPLARAVWRARLGNARLSTVEEAVCGVTRHDDLPGALIPQRYFDYLRDRHPGRLMAIVEHNRQDIHSLGLLLAATAKLAGDRSIWPNAHPVDLGGLGRALARRRRWQEALDCIDAALTAQAWQRGIVSGGHLWRRLATDRARLLGRLGRREQQLQAWLEIARRGGPGAAAAWLHIARHLEHQRHDIGGALAACQEAAAAIERARLWGRSAPAVERDLAHRLVRLRRRQQRLSRGISGMSSALVA